MEIEISAFRRRVFAVLSDVPIGQVTSYGELGRFIGCGSSRAIGQALRNNPFAPDVACHRVIRSDFSIGGYMGSVSNSRVRLKLNLLRDEGVFFDRDGFLLDRKNFYRFSS